MLSVLSETGTIVINVLLSNYAYLHYFNTIVIYILIHLYPSNIIV